MSDFLGVVVDGVPAADPPMPVPFGVDAVTGTTRPPLTEKDLERIPGDREEVKARAQSQRDLAIVPTIDPKDLSKAGWGIVFPKGVDPEVRKAMQPLIDHRAKQANRPGRFKVFEGNQGVIKPTQSAIDWLDRQGGVGLAVVDPANGVPYYLLLVGSPQQISFEFQFILDTQWCVGRIYFETPQEYAAYAQAVVDYETAAKTPHKKHAAMWMTHNAGDAATGMLLNQVGARFAKSGLGVDDGYQLTSFMDAQATKPQLADILRGKATDGPPAVLFTGSHGLEWPMTDADGQRKNQGALVTQEWVPRTPIQREQYFSAEDVPEDAKVQGMIYFMFACFGGGCPASDTYSQAATPTPIAPQSMIAKLPQKLLSKGALAVMAHVDRAWSWSFQTGSGMPQNQVIKSTIEAVMMGLRMGQAADFFNMQWSTLASLLGVYQGKREAGLQPVTPVALGNLFIARDDARNYTLLGDPAVRLRIEDMG